MYIGIQPASKDFALQRFTKTVQKAIQLKDYAHLIAPADWNALQRLFPDGLAYVWGNASGSNNNKFWNQLQLGDWMVFSYENGLQWIAPIAYKMENSALADALWPKLDPSHKSNEKLSFFKATYAIDIPYPAYRKYMDRKDNYIIERFSARPIPSVEHFFEGIWKEILAAGLEDTVYTRSGSYLGLRNDLLIPVPKPGYTAASGTSAPKSKPKSMPKSLTPTLLSLSDLVIADMTKCPMEINNFTFDNRVGMPIAAFNELQNRLPDIQYYHDNSQFARKNYLSLTGPMQGVTCNIIVEDDSYPDKLAEEINKIADAIEEVIATRDLPRELKSILEEYEGCLRNFHISPNFGESVKNLVDEFCLDPELAEQLKAMVDLAQVLVERLQEILNTLGYFTVKTPQLCEIHLLYNKINNIPIKNESYRMEMFYMVLAHELEHAWHYADVKSSSGNWLEPTKKVRQGHVKETIAEYFNLCYCKDRSLTEAFNWIHIHRDPFDFPRDGGYSGALLLEFNPRKLHDVYQESLQDMEKAHVIIEP